MPWLRSMRHGQKNTFKTVLEWWKTTWASVLVCYLFIFWAYFLEIPSYYPATALWAHRHSPWDPVTNTNISPFLTQQAPIPNQMSAGCLTCGQLGANTCLSLDKVLCASCIINNFGRLRGQELSCSEGAEHYNPLCCSFLLSIVQGNMQIAHNNSDLLRTEHTAL